MSNLHQIALVLGMHRSGTSALADAISRLGFDLGKNLLPANQFNASGYFENQKVVQFHDEILGQLASSWHDPRFLAESAFEGAWVDDAAQKLSSILEEEFGSNARIVVKDPRACRLLPIWKRLIAECDLDLRFVLVGRDPVEVSYSLAHRDHFSRQKSLLLWLQYNLVVERETRSSPRLILRYRDLLDRTEEYIGKVADFLDVKDAAGNESAVAAIDRSQAHHAATKLILSNHPGVRRWTKEVWQLLFQGDANDPTARKRLDKISKQLRQNLAILPEEAIGKGDHEAAFLRRAMARKNDELERLKERSAEQIRSLEKVMRERDEARRGVSTITAESSRRQEEISFLKDRHKERTATLEAVMLHRDEARKELEALKKKYEERTAVLEAVMLHRDEARKELASLKEKRRELASALEAMARDRDEARKELKATKTEIQALKAAANETQSSLKSELSRIRQQLSITDEEIDFAKAVFSASAARIASHELEWDRLREKLESLRHSWKALPLRKSLKELAGSPGLLPSGLARLNALSPSVWNCSLEDIRFGLGAFPDPEKPDRFIVEGWGLGEGGKTTLPALRLVNDTGQRRGGAKRKRSRVDVALLYPSSEAAGRSGFAFLDLAGFEKCRLEARHAAGDWRPLALIDLSGIGWQHLRDIHEIISSWLFDFGWYARRYDLTGLSSPALVSHYLREGAARGLWPNPLFDTQYYLESNLDVCATGENPLLAYLRSGKEGNPRQPNRWFEPSWYLAKYKHVAGTGLDPLAHYLQHGKQKKLNPGPQFDVSAYLRRNPDVSRSSLDPLAHFIHYGSAEGRRFPQPGDTIQWLFEKDPAPGRINVLLVGHVLGTKMFGSERSLLELIQMIDRSRFNIYCSFPQSEPSFIDRIRQFVTGVAIFPYRWWSGASADNDGYDCDFEEVMRSRQIGLVHVNSIVLRDPLIAARRLKIPSILHLREIITRDPDLAARIGLPAEEIAAQVRERSEFVIANSHFTQDQHGVLDRSFVLYNTADEKTLDIAVRKRDAVLRVGMLSSNLPKKGLDGFFNVARAAQGRPESIEFWLVGPETEGVQHHLQANGGCPPNVHRTGYLDSPTDALAEVDVVLNLSTFAESFGRSVAEAMLARRPPVVYNYGALPELVRDGIDGFVVPFKDTEAVLDRLLWLAKEPARLAQMGEAARARAVQMFSREVGARNLNSIYESVITHARNGSDAAPEPEKAEDAISDARKSLRVGYFLWHFPVPSETFVLNELRYLVKHGYDVRVFCRQSPFKDFLPDFPIAFEQVDSIERLAQKLMMTERQIVHSHFVYPTVTKFLWPACESAQIPFTFIAHAQDIFRYENAELNRLGEVARSPWCRAVFAPGTFHRKLFIEQGVPAEKIVINPQSIPLDFFRRDALRAPKVSRERSMCAIHRFVEKKGLEHAIRAAVRLADKRIALYLYGYGPKEESLRALAAELGANNVHFPGELKERSAVVEALHKHDLFLAPSLRAADGDMDGVPTVLMEAMACGTPVVASDVSSLPDLVQDGVTGYVCAPDNTESLVEAILKFYNDPLSRVEAIKRRAREAVLASFDIEKATRTLTRIWSGEGIDIILVTHNNLPELKEVVRRVFRFTSRPFRLCVVDNNSDESVRGYLRTLATERANVRLSLLEENVFVGPGTNEGLRLGESPIAVYLCSKEGFVLQPDWDQKILDYMETHPRVGLAGTMAHSPSYLTGRAYVQNLERFPQFRKQDFALSHPDRIFAHVQGGVLVIRRAMFDAIGGFSEEVPHQHTDVEYSYYVESCGWELGDIAGVKAYYVKTLPPMTAHLTERVEVLHPASLEIAPLLDAVASRETEFCNVCAVPVQFDRVNHRQICPHCGATPFHRSLYRCIAESILPYRRLPALYISTPSKLTDLWERMFQGPRMTYDEAAAAIDKNQRLEMATGGRDVVVLEVPASLSQPGNVLLAELRRILKPDGTLFYSQSYGVHSLLQTSETDYLETAEQVIELLDSFGFHVKKQISYGSSAVRFQDRDIFAAQVA